MTYSTDTLLVDAGLLSDMGVQPGQTVQIELQSSDPINSPLKLMPVTKTPVKLPPIITVKAESGKKSINYCN
jgi:hypothetical protein